jgi:hypothetical protein
MSNPASPRILAPDDNVTFAFMPRVAVAVWRKDVTMTQLDAFATELRAFIPRCEGKGYASITVIEPTISLRMPDDVRKASEKLQRECAPHIQCMAYLVEARGFIAATARTVASGFTLVTRAPYPLKIFGTLGECSVWTSGHVGVGDRDIERLVHRARSTVSA